MRSGSAMGSGLTCELRLPKLVAHCNRNETRPHCPHCPKSYGIHVARLAGVPREVVERSKEILAQLEEEHLDAEGRAKIARPQPSARQGHLQLTLFAPADHHLLDDIRQLELDRLAPLDALGLIHKWQSELKTEKKKRRAK